MTAHHRLSELRELVYPMNRSWKICGQGQHSAIISGNRPHRDRSKKQITLALWFWNHTCTTRTLSPVSAARVSLTLKTCDIRNTEILACQSRRQNTRCAVHSKPSRPHLPQELVHVQRSAKPQTEHCFPSVGETVLPQGSEEKQRHSSRLVF